MIPSRVVVDNRERQSGVPEALSKMSVRVYFSTLPVADYVLSPEVAVERKSLPDFVSSVYDGRLFKQASEISAAYRRPYLIVEGDTEKVSGLVKNLASYYGALAAVTLAYDLRILHTANREETAVAIAELVRHSRQKRGPPPAPVSLSPKGKDMPQQQLYFVSSLPGVGPKLAQRLLSRYGTPRRVASLTEAQLAMVPGLGWKRAEKLVRMMDTKYSGQKEETAVQERLGE